MSTKPPKDPSARPPAPPAEPPADLEVLFDALVHLRAVGFEDVSWTPGSGSSSSPQTQSDAGRRGPGLSKETTLLPSTHPDSRPSVPSPGDDPPSEGPDLAAIAALAELGKQAQGCVRCQLCRTRKSVVFGAGHPQARLLLIGEGPGAREDEQGLPFVGPAGQLLDKIIGAIGWSRDQVYITNVVKCRPPNNRNPEPGEASACRGFLDRQIDLISPKVIVALGKVAAQTLLGNNLALGAMRGEWYTVRGVPTRVTYHPAALLRNSGFKRPTWEDMQIVRDRLLD